MPADAPAYPQLFSELKIRDLTLKNRIVWLPHLTCFGESDDSIGDRYIAYYVERAKGGVGLIVTGSENSIPDAYNWFGRINAYDPANVPQFRRLTEEVHRHGTAIFGQITDDGVETTGVETLDWNVPRGPSEERDALVQVTGKEMERDDIAEAVRYFGLSAKTHLDGGFDGIELKAGHDGLLRQFLSPASNHRDDEYGGSVENRMRFLRESVDEVRRQVGADFIVGVRLCCDEGLADGYGVDEAVEFARRIGEWGTVDYISSDGGSFGNLVLLGPEMSVEQGFMVPVAKRIKEASGLPVIAYGRIKEPPMAEEIVRNGSADMVGMARAMIAEPEWANKAREGRGLDIRYCIGCNQACLGRLFNRLAISCVVNPVAGREAEWGRDRPLRDGEGRKVVVVGGGPAGVKLAEVLAQRGCEVTLFERERNLGGKVNLLYDLPARREFTDATAWLESRLPELGVDVRCGMEVKSDSLEAGAAGGRANVVAVAVGPPATPGTMVEVEADEVIFATGAAPLASPFSPRVPTTDVLGPFDQEAELGERVLLWDAELGYAALAAAERLLMEGREVTMVTAADFPASTIPAPNIEPQLKRLYGAGMRTLTHSTLVEAEDGELRVANVYSGAEAEAPEFDLVLAANGWRGDDELYRWLSSSFPRARRVGDCEAPRDVGMAIYAGERLGREL